MILEKLFPHACVSVNMSLDVTTHHEKIKPNKVPFARLLVIFEELDEPTYYS